MDLIIDFDEEILYGWDQAYVTHPVVFPTVSFSLVATPALKQMCKRKGWSLGDFYIGINGYTDSRVDTCLEMYSDEWHFIDLTEEEQRAIYKCLSDQCVKHLGKSCEKLLAEAEERMYARVV